MNGGTVYVKDVLNSSLPEEVYGTQKSHPEERITSLMIKSMEGRGGPKVKEQLSSYFVLHKIKSVRKQKVIKRNRFLSRHERAELNILKLNKDGWNYELLEPMRELWKEYMRDNLDRTKKVPICSDADWNSFSVTLGKSEFVGAEIRVVRSTVPNLIDLGGTIVLETKQSFQVVTRKNELKILLKQPCVFEIILDNFKFTIFGKHLLTRPSERSVKKIKTFMNPDL